MGWLGSSLGFGPKTRRICCCSALRGSGRFLAALLSSKSTSTLMYSAPMAVPQPQPRPMPTPQPPPDAQVSKALDNNHLSTLEARNRSLCVQA